jgi:glycosyltransferase involved in cell wall biosynthesis
MIADGTAPIAELKTLVALIRLLRQLRPCLVLGFTPKGNIYAGLAARATGTPFLPNVSGLGTAFIKGGLLLKVQAALYREAFRSLPLVFFQNRDDAALFESMGLVGKHQVRLIPGTANRTAVSRAELQGWEREGLLIHAGRSDDVRPFMAKADAVVLPSYREGMPRALLEAAAMSRPLLAADVPGCREIVRDGVNGLLFEVRSEERLAEAIERFLLASFAERRGWAVRAREIAEGEYDERLVVDAYRDAVIALTGKGG